jgi:hypothetical protein
LLKQRQTLLAPGSILEPRRRLRFGAAECSFQYALLSLYSPDYMLI